MRALSALLVQITLAMKVTLPPIRAEPPLILLMSDLGLAPGAVIAANITVTQGSAVLMLFTKSELLSWERSLMKLPQQDLQNATSYFRSQWRQPFRHYLSARMTVPGPKPERYVVGLFHNCGAEQTFEGDLQFVNPGNQHLSLQAVYLPRIFEVSSIAFLVLVQATLIMMCSVGSVERHKLHVLLMAATGVKALELAAKANTYHALARTGEVAEWKLQACSFLTDLHGLFELLLLGLVALGWKIIRSRLAPHIVQGIRWCCVFYLALVMVQAVAAREFKPMFLLVFFSLRATIYLCIIFALNYSLHTVAVGLEGQQFCQMGVLLYRKQEALFRFRSVYYMLLFRPMALLSIQRNLLTEIDTQWALYCLKEASIWFIYWQLLLTIQPLYREDSFMQFANSTPQRDTGFRVVVEPPMPPPPAVVRNTNPSRVPPRPRAQVAPGPAMSNVDGFLMLQAAEWAPGELTPYFQLAD